ncbi:MAG: LytTR family transcriptional regulator DNA-binding domain-containing protein [Lachnospiraceae bacterium]|nr:LytTR family transcriptional regulator DNA-binding domain-containing protein [Lachnospiraceae bacterium]
MAEILVFQKGQKSLQKKKYGRVLKIVTEKERAKQELFRQTYRMILIDLEGIEEIGIEFAFFIRGIKQYFQTPILFFARDNTYEQLAFHRIHCYDFMLKPISRRDMYQILCLYLIKHEITEDKKRIPIPIQGSIYLINIQDILYMESLNRHIYVHLKYQTLEVPYRKMCECIAFDKERFVQCQRSFVVNRDYIYRLDYAMHCIELREGLGKIPMGRKYEKELRREFDRGFPLEYTN